VDKIGRPIVVNTIATIDPAAVYADMDIFKKWRLQNQEKTVRSFAFKNGAAETIVTVLDFHGISKESYTAEVKAGNKIMLGLLSDHYPECAGKTFLIRTPWFFTALFAALKPFIPRRTFEKFNLAGSEPAGILLEDLEPEQLPVQWCGLGDVPDNGATGKIVVCDIRSRSTATVEFPFYRVGVQSVIFEFRVIAEDVKMGASVDGREVKKLVKHECSDGPVKLQWNLDDSSDGMRKSIVVVTFDNKSSWVSDRRVLYRVTLVERDWELSI
jgi:hypothetical protein